jgi:hypothetical protein
MSLNQLVGFSVIALAGAGALLVFVATPQAMTLPVSGYATPEVQNVECAIGAHIGPLGGCILGHDDNPPMPVPVERRAVDAPDSQSADGCSSKSVTKTDGMGNTETKTKTNC